ncbi:MAG TPA: hypothetical protein VGE62_02125 [Candidatus Paceibacterota bacterium]
MNPITLEFTISGNQEDPKGNPIGYHRTTQGSYWNEGSRRYKSWKDYVVKAYAGKYADMITAARNWDGKPISLEKNQKAYLHTYSYFANNARPDPDNVQKGIADALFVNDKNVSGSYDFEISKEKIGKVMVRIVIVQLAV